MNVFTLPRTEEEAVTFLQEKGVLSARLLCQNSLEMKLYFGWRNSWACKKSTYRQKKVNIHTGNWFTDGCPPVMIAARFSYCRRSSCARTNWT